MKKFFKVMMQLLVLVLLFVLGIGIIHFVYIVSINSNQEWQLQKQCKEYAQANNVELLDSLNFFYYRERIDNAACVIEDLYPRIVWIDGAGTLLTSRNYRSYQAIEGYDSTDETQTYTLSFYEDKPVYIWRRITNQQLRIGYYSFDWPQLLFEIDSEE